MAVIWTTYVHIKLYQKKFLKNSYIGMVRSLIPMWWSSNKEAQMSFLEGNALRMMSHTTAGRRQCRPGFRRERSVGSLPRHPFFWLVPSVPFSYNKITTLSIALSWVLWTYSSALLKLGVVFRDPQTQLVSEMSRGDFSLFASFCTTIRSQLR